ncbi:putative mitochondrial carrier domain protein [Helianthus annuus]|nr:putative mitochondrial carrier domain protein [Helianthus annuus]
MADVAKDLTAGTIGGAAQLIVGHPFDTIKVKLQSQPVPPPGQLPRYSGAIDAVKQTIAAEGPRGLYKGMGAPLATRRPDPTQEMESEWQQKSRKDVVVYFLCKDRHLEPAQFIEVALASSEGLF